MGSFLTLKYNSPFYVDKRLWQTRIVIPVPYSDVQINECEIHATFEYTYLLIPRCSSMS